MSAFRPVTIRPRTGFQSNGHQSFYIGVPWQIAEAIPGDHEFVPAIDGLTGVLTFTPTSEPEQLVSFGTVMAALAACRVDQEQSKAVREVLRALPYARMADR